VMLAAAVGPIASGQAHLSTQSHAAPTVTSVPGSTPASAPGAVDTAIESPPDNERE
jgi:hypothetical protein